MNEFKKQLLKKACFFFFKKMSWQEVINHEDYEICEQYPYQIRKKSTGKILSESISNDGYYRVKLNGKKYYKHRLIAEQFITNDEPERKTLIYHINRDKTDNHISNLRWVSVNFANFNRLKDGQRFVKELPESAIEVKNYGNNYKDLHGLYYCDDVFYVFNGYDYKTLNKRSRNGHDIVEINIPDGYGSFTITYRKFKDEYGLD